MKKHYLLISIVSLFLTANYLSAQVTGVTPYIDAPDGILIKDNYLYIAASYEDKIYKIDLSDPNQTLIPVVDTGLDYPVGLLLIGNELYIADQVSVSKINITDPVPATLVTVVTGLEGATRLALYNDVELYIAEFDIDRISKINITDATPTLTTVVDLGVKDGPWGLLLHQTDLYIAEYTTGTISKIDVTAPLPPTVNPVITGLFGPDGLALKGNDLYISEYGAGKISKIDITASTPIATDVVTGLIRPTGIVINGDDLYIAEEERVSKFDLSVLGIEELSAIEGVLYPNPTTEFIQFSNLKDLQNFKIYNIQGALMLEGEVIGDERINVQNLTTGTYFMVLNDLKGVKFLKN